MIDMEDPQAVLRLALAGLYAGVLLARGSLSPPPLLAQVSVEIADALIAALDAPAP